MADTYSMVAGPTARVKKLRKETGSGFYADAVAIVDGEGNLVSGGGATTLAFIPTITASPDYSALDVVGGIQTIANAAAVSGRPIKLKSITLKDKGGQGPALTFLFFKATPASGTYTDNGALVLGSGDLANLVGSVQFVAGDWYSPVSGSKVATLSGMDLVLDVDATSLFALIIHDGTAWNAASTSDLQVELGIERL